jgi:5'-nucleotidase
MIVRLIQHWERLRLPHRTILNVNVPDIPLEDIQGFRVTRLGHRGRAKNVLELEDPRGKKSYWIGIVGEPADAGDGTDFQAVHQGFVSVTPLSVDLTRHDALTDVARWLRDI